jgi:hypothetical protein
MDLPETPVPVIKPAGFLKMFDRHSYFSRSEADVVDDPPNPRKTPDQQADIFFRLSPAYFA